MDIAGYFIEKRTSSWLFTVLLVIGGSLAFTQLGQLEDPQFTLKQAMVITRYPGASPIQVEEEVTFPIENAIQQLPYVDHVKSISSVGMSQIIVEMKSTYRKQELRQIWDELRRKINDLSPKLPPGAYPPMIKDDFGDVFGILLAVTGSGYAYDELRDFTDYLRRELVLVPGVGKVNVDGVQQEQVVVEISRARLTSLGIPPQQIYQLLATQNQVSNAGKVKVGAELIRLHPTGEFSQVSELESLIISNPRANEQIYLGDVAKVYRDYVEVPNHLMQYNGKQALVLGISFTSGVNVVDVGKSIEQTLTQLKFQQPVGMEVSTIYNQSNEVERSVDGFLLSLAEAVVIVIVVLLLFMGVRTGVLIGLILFITVIGSFIFIKMMEIDLQRVSLGALIIALGMLVDNAIVVAEGVLIGIKKQMSKLEAARLIVKQTKWPLLGATFIAVTAFAPIGLSSDATGEFAGSLFWVLLISLFLSWVTAITLTPFFADNLLVASSRGEQGQEELYGSPVFKIYRGLLVRCLQWPKMTMAFMFILLIAAILAFSKVKQAFFPASNTPMFLVDLWHQQGTDIRTVQSGVNDVSSFLQRRDGVEQVTTTIGRGATRFMLTYQPEKSYAEYGQLIVRVADKEMLRPTMLALREYLESTQSHLEYKLKRIEIGPATAAKIEARFSGPDPLVLRQLSRQAKQILKSDSGAYNVRDDWRQQTKVIRPVFNESAARRVGISKKDVDSLLQMSFSGMQVGLYRDGTQLIPIVARPPEQERLTIDSIRNLQIFSSSYNRYIPITNVVTDFKIEWEDPLIMRRDRKRTITVMADHDILGNETAAKLFSRIKSNIEDVELPSGYELRWGGEYEASAKAQKALFSALPLGVVAMFVVTVLLFNSIRSALAIWSCVPFAVVGVSFGLLLMGKPFGFMALLGFLSLSGMLIKNGIVLLEQIKIEIEEGKGAYDAIIHASVSRVRPVSMAAITTILGMIPLLFDDFFASMSVVIMFGLGFATVLTLIVIPVMYKSLFMVRVADRG